MNYRERSHVRDNWVEIRKSWTAPEDVAAHEYENDFLDYQLYTENCVYVVALVSQLAVLIVDRTACAAFVAVAQASCPR
jgi:hypothetical protein